MSGRLSRLTLIFAVLAAVLSGLASTSQSADPVIGPYYEDPTEAELAFYDAEYPCPPIDGLENTGRTVNVTGEVSIRCDYTQADVNRQQTLNVKWLKPDYDSYATYLCEDVPDRQADDSFIRDTVLATTPNAIRGEYSLSNAPELEPAFQAAAQSMVTAATPLSRGCAEPPTTLDCPEVPGHALGFADDADDIQPDTFAQDCSYESSSPEKGDAFKIDVWWAAQGGVPALRDRLCSEIPTEGVGVGVLTAPGTAVRATYWRFSPLEGPDVEVARGAAQALLDQAAPIAADCDGAATVAATSTDLPDYLADAFVPALTGTPAGGGGLDSLPTTAPAAASADDGTLLKNLIRIGSVVMFGLSMLGLFITFLMVKRETRIRERRDMLRIAITMGVAIITALILGRDAPLWAILVGVGLGVAVGTWQGSTLLVRSTERGLVAKRSLVGIVAFAVGILLMQAAGFLNRTGGLTLGVAVSFLSAALTAGLFVGRKPRMMQALGNATRVLLPLALIVGLLAGFGVTAGEAQTGPAPGTCPESGFYLDLSQCEGYEHLLDVVPWDSAFVSGGLWWDDGKPPIEVSLPRGLPTAPEPASQTASWSSTESSGATLDFTIEETYTFGLLPDGLCCTVSYDATGTRTRTPVDGEPTVETHVAAGRLDDIHVVGRVGLGSNLPFGIPFTEKLQLRGYPEDSCQRIVAQRQDDNTEGAATWTTQTVDGEDRGYVSSEINVFIDCDLPDFTYENALALAAPVPSAADPVRVVGGGFGNDGEICPVRQEFARYMWDAGLFEGVHTLTLGELFLEPNRAQCDYGGLFSPPAFGGGGRGDTRHEIIYRLAIQNNPVAEAARLADDEDTFASQSLPASIPAHERCEIGSDGVPIQPPEGETCRSISVIILGDDGGFSSLRQTGQTTEVRNVAGGQVHIETDWDLADGPNVSVRAHMPWGKYIYRCHHCTPGSPSITEFINSLHHFGSERGMGDPDTAKDDPVPIGTTATTEADPDFTESTEFIPVGEDGHDEEGLSDEEVALIGLVGLLGSMGLLAASLEGTGLTPGDIAAAIGRGDLTGGVGAAPELLDEDGDPLFVNDGSYPEAPVGHVWWGTDGDEGRWVSPEDAQELVDEARAADTNLEADRAAALQRARTEWGQDWEDLIRTSRAQAAADRMQAAMEREERATLIEGAAEARDAAAAANHEDLLDFMERNPLLTAEQIAAIFDAINRRGADQAALDAIPEVNVWREGAEGTLNDLADLADQAGRPEIAWMLRNPGVSVRVGAAVATGGYSEFIAVPIDITQRLQAAQERSLRENGRMMNNEELFGELGWALGTEAVYEVGGRLVGAGIGHVFSSGDEVIEAGIRELDEAGEAVARETTEEVSEAVSREASEAAERLGRSGDEVTGAAAREGTEEAAEAATREGTQEATEAATREGAEEATEAATREGTQEATEAAAREGAEEAAEAAARQAEELTPVPPKGNEGIANLETGARIPDEMMEQTGLPRRQLDDLETYARENDLNLTGRATNPHSAAALADGSAVGKPLDIKIKTGNDIDVLLGAKPQNRGVVTLFEPVMPPTKGMSPELVQALERRHAQRMAEWNKYKNTWTEGSERVAGFGGTQRTQRMVDGRLEVLYDGKWRKVGGDFDLVDMTRADGSPLSPAEFQQHVDGLIERGLIEHGGEVRVMTDIMRNNPHPPGSDEWMAAARETWALRESLENAQMAGEINIGINGVHGVHRAPDIDDFLPWKGGLEAPGGGLLTP